MNNTVAKTGDFNPTRVDSHQRAQDQTNANAMNASSWLLNLDSWSGVLFTCGIRVL